MDGQKDLIPQTSAPKYIPQGSIVAMLESGMSQSDIAREFKVTPSAISLRLKDIGYSKKALAIFRDQKANILEWHQDRLLSSVTDAEIKKMAPRDRYWAAAVCHDKIRLERGQTTENVGQVHHMIHRVHTSKTAQKVVDSPTGNE